MKLATTTYDFDKFLPTIEERIKAVHDAGFKYIDLSFYIENTPESVFMQPDWREYTLKLKVLAEESGIEFV